jgi:phytoene dehydrogenase-like protein
VEFAHPFDGGRAAIVTRSVAATAGRLGADGPAYRRLIGPLARHSDELAAAILAPLRRLPAHPVVLAAYGSRAVLPMSAVVRRWRTQQARGLLAGAAAHAGMPLTASPTAGFALMLCARAHGVGWPVVAGGSARIAAAMADAVLTAGGSIEPGWWVRSLAELPPAAAVLLDVSPRALASLAGDRLPDRYRAALHRFRYGPGVCKVDFALSGPVPWTNQDCRRAGTLHLGGTFEQIAAAEAEVAAGQHPRYPYVLVVQPGVADQSRAPAGRQTLWTYCHVPSGSDVDMTGRIQAQIERFAPGFGDLVLVRATRTAADEQALNPNYVGGDIAIGMKTLQQAVLRPLAQPSPYRTPIRGVYLCSSAAPPAPGVHGRCGELAALAALRDMFGLREAPDIGPARLPSAPPRASGPGRSVLPLPVRTLDGTRNWRSPRISGRCVLSACALTTRRRPSRGTLPPRRPSICLQAGVPRYHQARRSG